MAISEPLPGGDGSVLNPQGLDKIAERTVTRQAIYTPKDEEPPPSGSGKNWFEHNYPPRPAVMSIRLSIDPKPLADALAPYIETSNMEGVIRILSGCKPVVETQPNNPIVTLRLTP